MKDVVLAIRGGGVRSVIGIGALKAIEDSGLNVCAISGVSIGSIVATLYAAGFSADTILEKFIKNVEIFSNLDYKLSSFCRFGLSSSEKIEKAITDEFGEILFKDLKIPCKISAFNILRMKTIHINKDNFPNLSIGKGCRASCSFPFLFSLHRTKYDKKTYVLIDGGFLENPPVIDFPNAVKMVVSFKTKIYNMMLYGMSKKSENISDILIKPELAKIGIIGGVEQIKDAYEIGYKETIKQIELAKQKRSVIIN